MEAKHKSPYTYLAADHFDHVLTSTSLLGKSRAKVVAVYYIKYKTKSFAVLSWLKM